MRSEHRGQHQGPETTFTCIVYAEQTGRVVHVHQVAVLPGATARSKEHVDATALKMARQLEKSAELRVLHVSGEQLDAETEYHVDVLTRQLIATRSTERYINPQPEPPGTR